MKHTNTHTHTYTHTNTQTHTYRHTHTHRYQQLVDDAVSHGAKLLTGGYIYGSKADPDAKTAASKRKASCFYPPTILAGVSERAAIAQQEIFGPIMCIFNIKGDSDEAAVRLANDCEFALSSCVFAGDATRARGVASRVHAGMSAVNDLEGCTYMSQSLPFGGLKRSG